MLLKCIPFAPEETLANEDQLGWKGRGNSDLAIIRINEENNNSISPPPQNRKQINGNCNNLVSFDGKKIKISLQSLYLKNYKKIRSQNPGCP
jgi:hypothetical protein